MGQAPLSRGHTLAGLLPCLLLLLFLLRDSCCLDQLGQDKGKTGLVPEFGYRAVCGEAFVMQCAGPCSANLYNASANASQDIVWSRLDEDRRPRVLEDTGGVAIRGNALWFSAIEVKHSGYYVCQNRSLDNLPMVLELVVTGVLGCGDPEVRSSVVLEMDVEGGGWVYCPDLSDNRTSSLDLNTLWNRTSAPEPNIPGYRNSCLGSCTPVCWYKDAIGLEELKMKRQMTADGHKLHLESVYEVDDTVFFCDHHTRDQRGFSWTLRRAVKTTIIAKDTTEPPRIICPHVNEIEVELGQNFLLTCEVQFGFQRKSSLLLQWWQRGNPDNQEGGVLMEMEKQEEVKVSLTEVKVSRKAVIPQVTLQHLSSSFTCFASSSLGNQSATIRMILTPADGPPIVMGCAVVLVLLLTSVGASVTAHIYWLEISLLYRTYRPHTHMHTLTDGKLFDAFVSYVSSSVSEEGEEEGTAGTSLSDQAFQLPDVEASVPQPRCLSAGARVSEEPLELLLPRVLEEEWGYRLCLLERDLLPGGVYTDDVVSAVRSSRRLLCLLSPAYLGSPSGVFELEVGLQALLQDHQLQVVLIWTLRPPSLGPLKPALPPLVLRALRVLPALDWAPGQDRSDPQFWRTLRAAMPPLPDRFLT